MLLFTIPFVSVAQERKDTGRIDFYAGLDVVNAIVGGKILGTGERRNNQAIDFKGGWDLSYDWWKFGTFIEYFPTIDYFGLGLQFGVPIYRQQDIFGWETDLVVTPSLEGQLVWRDGLPKESYSEYVVIGESFNWALSLEIQFDQIFKNSPLYIEFQATLTKRNDKYNIWGRDVDPAGLLNGLWENRALYVSVGYEIFRSQKGAR